MRILMMVLVGLVLGCGDDPLSPQEAARAELDKRGIEYTADAFVAAAGSGNLEVVRLFLEAGMPVDTDRYGDTALHEAAWQGELEVVKYLVGLGARLGCYLSLVVLRLDRAAGAWGMGWMQDGLGGVAYISRNTLGQVRAFVNFQKSDFQGIFEKIGKIEVD